jgi:hypothetical protein
MNPVPPCTFETTKAPAAEQLGGPERRIDEDVETVRLENAVGRALGVVAAALVVEDRHLLGGTLAVAHAELQHVQSVVVGQRLDGGQTGDIDDFLGGDQDLVAAAIERRARLDHHVALAALGRRMLLDPEPTHDAGAVQPRVVMAHLFGVIVGLGRELGDAHHLPGEEVVAHERVELALRAVPWRRRFVEAAAHGRSFRSIVNR